MPLTSLASISVRRQERFQKQGLRSHRFQFRVESRHLPTLSLVGGMCFRFFDDKVLKPQYRPEQGATGQSDKQCRQRNVEEQNRLKISFHRYDAAAYWSSVLSAMTGIANGSLPAKV